MSRIYYYTVHANEPWMSTGLRLSGTARVIIEAASGRWTANPALGLVGAEGHVGFTAKSGYTLPGHPEGLLVGCIQEAPASGAAPPGVFAIGQKKELPSTAPGLLFLSINDDIERRHGVGHADNQGSLHVKVTVG